MQVYTKVQIDKTTEIRLIITVIIMKYDVLNTSFVHNSSNNCFQNFIHIRKPFLLFECELQRYVLIQIFSRLIFPIKKKAFVQVYCAQLEFRFLIILRQNLIVVRPEELISAVGAVNDNVNINSASLYTSLDTMSRLFIYLIINRFHTVTCMVNIYEFPHV